jgi:hypothetical protein
MKLELGKLAKGWRLCNIKAKKFDAQRIKELGAYPVLLFLPLQLVHHFEELFGHALRCLSYGHVSLSHRFRVAKREKPRQREAVANRGGKGVRSLFRLYGS